VIWPPRSLAAAPAMSTSPASDFFLGRQPIFDRSQRIVAYELLYRHDRTNRACVDDDVLATATVLRHVFGDLGVAAALGSCQGFVNVDEVLLLDDVLEFLPKEQIVLELLETVPITPQVVARVRQLHAQGFTMALDDFAADAASYEAILGCVAIAKVDLLSVDDASLRDVAAQLRRWPLRLLAEKVDSQAQAELCMELGFDLFQGNHLARPEMIEGRTLRPSQIALRDLLGRIAADADTATIHDSFRHHPDLSLSLLRLASSLGSGAACDPSTLRQAVTLLGPRNIRHWLQLLLHTCERSDPRVASPLLELATIRGRTMELLAEASFPERRDASEHAFVTGILSLMDATLGMPLARVLEGVAASTDVRDALLTRSGSLGALLELIESLESGSDARQERARAACPALTAEMIHTALGDALRWRRVAGEPSDGAPPRP
jgi:c-di-GMP-related signal transduction protein